MGWLHCEPEELFVPKLFGTTDLTSYVPRAIAWLCTPLTALLQSLADQFQMGNLLEFTFIARPIQVCLFTISPWEKSASRTQIVEAWHVMQEQTIIKGASKVGKAHYITTAAFDHDINIPARAALASCL